MQALSGLSGLSGLVGGGLVPPTKIPNLALWHQGDQGVNTNGASGFTRTSSQFYSIPDAPALRTGNANFALAGWFWLNSNAPATNGWLVSKWSGSHAEYVLGLLTNGNLRFQVSDGATTTVGVVDRAAPAANGWHYIVAWLDTSGPNVNIQVDDGSITTVALTGTPATTTTAFRFGSIDGTQQFLDGRLQGWLLTKRLLTAAEKTALYNAGAGVRWGTLPATVNDGSLSLYSDLGIVSAGDAPVDRSTNAFTITNNASVAPAVGVSLVTAADGDPVASWTDLSGGASSLQAVAAKRGAFKAGILNGHAVVRLDGVDDYLTNTLALTSTNGFTAFLVVANVSAALDAMYMLTLKMEDLSHLFLLGKAGNAGLGGKSPYAGFRGSNNWVPSGAQTFTGGMTPGTLLDFNYSGGARNTTANYGYTDNHVAQPLGTSGAIGGGDNATMIGSAETPGTFAAADYAEIVVYSRQLTAFEQSQVRAYLNSRYAMY